MPLPASVGPPGQPDATRWTLSDTFINSPGPFFNGTNRYLVLVNAGDNGNVWPVGGGAPANPSYCHVVKSVDGGNTWAEMDAVNARELPQGNTADPQTFRFRSVSVVQVGTILVIARLMWDYVTYQSAAPRVCVLSRFDMALDTWLADLTTAADPNAPVITWNDGDISNNQVMWFLGRRAADGHLFLAYTRGDVVPASPRFPLHYDHAVYQEWIPGGGGWQPAVYLYGGAGTQEDTYPNGPPVEGDAARMHFLTLKYRRAAPFNTATEVLHAALPFGGVLTASQSVYAEYDWIDTSAQYYAACPLVVRQNGATRELLFAYREARVFPGVPAPGTKRLFVARADSADVPAWNTTLVQSLFGWTATWANMSIGAFPITSDDVGTLHMFSRGTDTDLNQFNSGWVVVPPAATLYSNPFLLGALDATAPPGSGVVGIVFTNGPTGLYAADDVWYTEIAAAPPPPPATVVGMGAGGGGGAPFSVVSSVMCGRPPSEYDACLSRLYRGMLKAARLWSVCRTSPPPWISMPSGGRRFQATGSVPKPAAIDTDVLVLETRVPLGWDGILVSLYEYFVPTFANASGQLTWRLMVDDRWVKDYDSILIALGRPGFPVRLKGAGIRLLSGQTLRYFVSMSAAGMGALNPAGSVICGLFGWYYPRATNDREVVTRVRWQARREGLRRR